MRASHLRAYPDGAAAKLDIFHGYRIHSPHYHELVISFGGYGERVEEPANLREALERGLDAVKGGKLALIDVILEPKPPG